MFLVDSDIPMAYPDGKRNKTYVCCVYSEIPMAYPDGERNKTNVVFFVLF